MTVQVWADAQHGTDAAASGAGVLWDPQGSNGRGLVITNAHVVRGAQATVGLGDGAVLPARVVARDRKRDLAALEFESSSAMFAQLREVPLQVGELVIAVGHPGGLVGVAALGIVHVAEDGRDDRRPRWIRADLRLAPGFSGFSGGPLADMSGKVIGINAMVHGSLALAVPVTTVESWLRRAQAPAA
ncbi:MAG: serine protease [Gemmatimonadetes bacterium]|nr:MAG: serine protease [Gemmatimonadota bacterium]